MTAVLKTAELSDKEKAFLRGEGVTRAVNATPELTDEEPAAPMNDATVTTTPKARSKGTVRVVPSLVGLATRIPADQHERLMRASFERKLEHVEPWTHQDIVSEALSEWFKRRGY